MPALAQHHVGVAFLEDVLGRHQQLVERRGQPALEQRRAPGAADLGQQRVVLHVARADLHDVGDLQHGVEVAHVHQLGDDRQPRLGLRLGEQPQALLARGPGRRRARCAACRRRRAGTIAPASRTTRAVCSICSRDSTVHGPGDQREVPAADLAPVDLEHRSLAVRDLRRGELVGLQDRHHPVDAGLSLEAEAFDAGVLLDVADRADHGHARAVNAVRARARPLDLLDDRLDLLLGRGLLHHDHHRFILSRRQILGGQHRRAGARLVSARPGTVAERAVSPCEKALGPLREPGATRSARSRRAQAEAPS